MYNNAHTIGEEEGLGGALKQNLQLDMFPFVRTVNGKTRQGIIYSQYQGE